MSWKPTNSLPWVLVVLGCAALPFAPTDGAILGVYAALFLPYAWACSRASHVPMAWIWDAAILARLALIGHDPLLSDDLYRYVWEGRVWLAGFNPFVDPPESSALVALRDTVIWPHINHPEVPTIYPPFAQALFAFNAVLGGGMIALRALLVAAELGCFLVAARALKLSNVAQALVVLNPLMIVETAWSGHIDGVAVGLLVLGCALWERRRVGAGLLLGLSIATKFLGVIGLALVIFAPLRPRERLRTRVGTLALALTVVALSYVPCLPQRPSDLGRGFATYASSWRSNDGVFRVWSDTTHSLLERWGQADGDKVLVRFSGLDDLALKVGWVKTWQGQTLPNTTFASDQIAQTLGKVLGGLCVLSVFLFAVWVIRDPWQGFGIVMLTLLLIAPTVHPWYVVWLVPFAARRLVGWAWGALLLSGLVILGYLAWLSDRIGGPWLVPWWASALEFGLTAVAALGTPPSSSPANNDRI